ncbi:MAG: Arc family DNA-binding protein [Candidatus Eisenbacteria bacterium]|uniref:Arc family DNA-binding protein n=1 Tax=Eiseniibacteriota bacterium TaxID=2212470 RepID=A0A956RTA1_UNCEI|nr:Arc family DNA-binding protein [Candidatus Eisenbacteria bacterium]
MTQKKAFPLRLDPELYDQVRRWAEAELRSVNAQIEFLLKQAVEARFGRAGRSGQGTREAAGDDEAGEG